MKKLKVIMLLLISICTMFLCFGKTAYGDTTKTISVNGVDLQEPAQSEADGFIVISGSTDNKDIKALIIKDGVKEWKDIKVIDGKYSEKIWLTMGKGQYTVAVMVHSDGKSYKYGPKIEVYNQAEISKYAAPEKDIESDNEEIASLAKKITEGKKTDTDKARAIYDWVSSSITYDYKKYDDLLNKNENDAYGALNTLKTLKGICYDYSTLTAALGRAAGLNVKVIEGYKESGSNKQSHNWNEFYISEEDIWIKADTTSYTTTKIDNFNREDIYANYIKTGEF